MTQNKTINEQIEELKKGCGKELKKKAFENPSLSLYCGIEIFVSESVGLKVILCPTCQARLEGFQKGKLEQKKEDKNKQDEFYNEFDLASNCSKDDKLFKKLWNKYFKQLQKEIGEEKQDE